MVIVLLVLILLNGVFALCEIAFVSAKRSKLEADAKRGSPRAKTALKVLKKPDIFLSTIQIGITLIGILMGIYSGKNITDDLERFLLTIPYISYSAEGLAIGIVVVMITFFTLVLGEIVPKRIALSSPEGYSKILAKPMLYLSRVTAPFVWLLSGTSNLILRILRVKQEESTITEDEIRAIINEGKIGGVVQEVEQDIVERVFHLGDRRISSLMTYRTNIVYIPHDANQEKVKSIIGQSHHSIYPIVKNDLGNVIGIIRIEDIFIPISSEGFELSKYIKPPSYIMATTSVYKALEILKGADVNYGLVTDASGTTIGLITIRDILRALIGGDTLENDSKNPNIIEREDGSYLVDGDFPFHEFLHYFELPPDPKMAHIDTIGGFMLHILDRIPDEGEKVKWKYLEIEVVDMDRVKIDKLLVKEIRGYES